MVVFFLRTEFVILSCGQSASSVRLADITFIEHGTRTLSDVFGVAIYSL